MDINTYEIINPQKDTTSTKKLQRAFKKVILKRRIENQAMNSNNDGKYNNFENSNCKNITITSNSSTKRIFRCPKCNYVTDRKNNLKRHISTMHDNCDKVLECCGIVFPNKSSLREHVSLRHKEGYICGECGRNFCRKALLKRHVTVHSGQKDYVCSICNYATSHKSNLDRHTRRHKPKHTDPGRDLGVTHSSNWKRHIFLPEVPTITHLDCQFSTFIQPSYTNYIGWESPLTRRKQVEILSNGSLPSSASRDLLYKSLVDMDMLAIRLQDRYSMYIDGHISQAIPANGNHIQVTSFETKRDSEVNVEFNSHPVFDNSLRHPQVNSFVKNKYNYKLKTTQEDNINTVISKLYNNKDNTNETSENSNFSVVSHNCGLHEFKNTLIQANMLANTNEKLEKYDMPSPNYNTEPGGVLDLSPNNKSISSPSIRDEKINIKAQTNSKLFANEVSQIDNRCSFDHRRDTTIHSQSEQEPNEYSNTFNKTSIEVNPENDNFSISGKKRMQIFPYKYKCSNPNCTGIFQNQVLLSEHVQNCVCNQAENAVMLPGRPLTSYFKSLMVKYVDASKL